MAPRVASAGPHPVEGQREAPATAAAAAGAGGGHGAVATVLGRVQAELVDLHAVVLGLQDTLGPTLAAAAADLDVLKGSQALDLVAQWLDGLSTFVRSIAGCDPGLDRWDAGAAAEGVALHGLAARLAGRTDDLRSSHDEQDAFELL